MKFALREFARKIREHTPELTKHLERLAADAYAISNMPGWDDQEMARKGLNLPGDIEMPVPPKKK